MKQTVIPRLGSLSIILLVALLPARAERLPVKIFTSADGLGSSFVDFLMRDSRGFMWFCTRDGLSRFDGARFITYRIGDKNTPPGIENITETGGGSYWITTTGGLYYFKADVLSQTDNGGGDRPLLNAKHIDGRRGTFLEDLQGNLWLMSGDLFRAYERNGTLELEKNSLNLPANPNRPFYYFQARRGPDGSFWMNSNQGLIRRTPDGRVTMFWHETDIRQGNSDLLIERNGRVWVGWGSEIFVLQPGPIESSSPNQFSEQTLNATRTLELKPDQSIELPHAPGETLRLTRHSQGNLRLSQTADEHVWVISNNDLLEFDQHTFHVYNASSSGLPLGMLSMAEDIAGNLWIASSTGAARWDRKGLISYGVNDGLKSPAIFAITEAPDGTLYFANGDFNLSRFDGQGFQTNRPQLPADAQSLWSSRYAHLSSANEWWVLTSEKLYRFAAANLQRPLAIYGRDHGLVANHPFQIFEDSRGDIWLSQQPARRQDFGLYRLRPGEDQFYRFSPAENFPPEKAASSFAEDRQGNLWFGFYEGGLARFVHDRFELFTTNDGLASGLISDLHLDHQGRLWIASTFSGLQRIDDPAAPKPAFRSFTINEGLSSNNVRTITEDRLGNIYAGTVRGVDRISPDGLVKHYSVNDGLAGDFVVDSHCDRNGNLWFATTNGLSRLAPNSANAPALPGVLLSGLRIAGEKQTVPELGDAQIQTGELNYTRNNLQIDFFGLDFRPGETLRYQFMLEGADANWGLPTEQRTVTYANLKAGSYRFLVRAVGADGSVSNPPAVVSFTILPPIWLRWWFLALVTLLTLALLYLFYRYRIARLHEARRAEEQLSKARQERLVELEQVRKRIATDLHDDIGSSLTRISLLSEVAQRQRNEADGHVSLSTIAGLSRELVDSMSDIVWAINPERDHLGDLTQRMRRFAGDVFSARGIDFKLQLPAPEANIRLRANLRREVFLIFKEAVNNAVRHSGCTTAEIDFRVVDEHKLLLQLSDNGRGFDVSSKGNGHGLASMRARTEALGGQLSIESAAGSGTVLLFDIPLNPRDDSPPSSGNRKRRTA